MTKSARRLEYGILYLKRARGIKARSLAAEFTAVKLAT